MASASDSGSSADGAEMAIAAPPLLERLEMEHALDMQRLRSEQAAQQLKSGARALRQEERTSQAMRAECAALAAQLQALQVQHSSLAQQHSQLVEPPPFPQDDATEAVGAAAPGGEGHAPTST